MTGSTLPLQGRCSSGLQDLERDRLERDLAVDGLDLVLHDHVEAGHVVCQPLAKILEEPLDRLVRADGDVLDVLDQRSRPVLADLRLMSD